MLGPYIIVSQLLYTPVALLLWFRGYRTTQRVDEQDCQIAVRVDIFGAQVLDILVFTFFSLTYQLCSFSDKCIYPPAILLFGVKFMSFFLLTTISSGFIVDQPIATSGLLHDSYRVGMALFTLGLMADGVDPDSVALPILLLLAATCILAVHHIIIFSIMPCGKVVTALERRKIKCLGLASAFLCLGFGLLMFSRKAVLEEPVFHGLVLGYTACFSVGLWFWAWSMNVEEIEAKQDDITEFDSVTENKKYAARKAKEKAKDMQLDGDNSQEDSDCRL
jgi:hypothetical protein